MAVSPRTCIQYLPARDARSPKRLSAPRAESGHHPDAVPGVTLFGHETLNFGTRTTERCCKSNDVFQPRFPRGGKEIFARTLWRITPFTLDHAGGHLMHDPGSLREQARRCRALSKTAVEPEVIEQLRVWAVELAEEADQAEWRAAEGEETIVSV